MKINNDKYYTDLNIAKFCIDKTIEIIGRDNISEIIEPSAGNGSFSLQIPNCVAYDIIPEHESIITQDYLELNLSYKKGRLIIGNPPFGTKLKLALDFFKKSIEIGDYIAFILPISQLNNSNMMYEFELIYSEDLGKLDYSSVNLHCCFNIYKRPLILNKKPINKLTDIKIYRQDCNGYDNINDYEIRLCYWGSGSAGKILKNNEHYSGEYKIKIFNESLKKSIINMFETIDWKKELNCIAMTRIKNYHIYDALKKYIPTIK